MLIVIVVASVRDPSFTLRLRAFDFPLPPRGATDRLSPPSRTLPNGTEITQGGDYPDYPKGTAKDGGGAPDKVQNESGSDSTSSSAKESGTAGASGQESKASSSSSSGGDSGGNP